MRKRLSSRKGFVWLKREITAKQQQDIHKLGLPGIGFLRENKRVYPNGPEVSHLIGLVNIDNQGIAGMILKPWNERTRTAQQIKPLMQAKLNAIEGMSAFAFSLPPLPGLMLGLPFFASSLSTSGCAIFWRDARLLSLPVVA